MKTTHQRKRAKLTGKGKSHSFLRLPHYVTDSEQFAMLSGKAVKLLIEIARQYRGNNNGDLSIPWIRLRVRGWSSEVTVRKARDELLDAGWILITRHGGNHVCALYAVTWEAIDECAGKGLELPPTSTAPNDWQKQKLHVRNCRVSPGNTSETDAIAA